MLQRGVIDFEKGERLMVEDPHRNWIAIEDEPVLLFAVAQSLFGALAIGNIARVDHDRFHFRVGQPILGHRFQIAR